MAKEIIDAIRDAENMTQTNEDIARAKVKSMIDDAKKEAASIIDKAMTDARQKADAMIDDIKAKGDKDIADCEAGINERVKLVIQNADSKMDDAIEAVIESLTR